MDLCISSTTSLYLSLSLSLFLSLFSFFLSLPLSLGLYITIISHNLSHICRSPYLSSPASLIMLTMFQQVRTATNRNLPVQLAKHTARPNVRCPTGIGPVRGVFSVGPELKLRASCEQVANNWVQHIFTQQLGHRKRPSCGLQRCCT